MFLETCCSRLFLLFPALKNIRKIPVSMFYTNSENKHKIMLHSSDISITFLWFVKIFSKIKMNLKGYGNTVSIKNWFYSIYRFDVVVFFFLDLFLILWKMVENKSEIVLTKNNKLSLKMQKFSLRLNILLFFCNPSSVLKTRHFFLTLG